MKAPLTDACFFLKSTWQSSLRWALTALLLAPLSPLHTAETPIPLWPQGAPGALGTAGKDIPTLTPYLPDAPCGAAILLIPGGSYGGIYPGQGEPIARWLNEQGLIGILIGIRFSPSAAP